MHINVAGDLLARLDQRQKATLTAGADYWRTPTIDGMPVGALKVTDGPVGARGDLTSGTTSTCFPCGSAVGATWDVELATALGEALAEETRAKGAHVLLAPTVNLHRHPLAGRNFECMSEDPELTARLAAALVNGLQGAGVGACVKHFVANDQETDRFSVDARVGERTLREIYLRPFEAVVAEADPWTVMAAYNKVNGTYATANHRLLVEILKEEWGWSGAVISDWWATHDTVSAAAGGLDLEMPGPAKWLGPQLADAVARGEVSQARLDDMAGRLLRLLGRAGLLHNPEPEHSERSDESDERTALARRISADAIVLLRNEQSTLPMSAHLASIAVVGPAADPGFALGGGSALVHPHRLVGPVDGLRAAVPGARIEVARGCPHGRFAPPIRPDLLADGHWTAEFWNGSQAAGDPVHSGRYDAVRYSFFGNKIPGIADPCQMRARYSATFTPDQTGPWRLVLACAGTVSVSVAGQQVLGNGSDVPKGQIMAGPMLATHESAVELESGEPVSIEIDLAVATPGCLPHLYFGAHPPDPAAEINAAAALAAAAEQAIVVVGTGPEFESEGFDRPSMELPGDQNALVAAVLAAAPNAIVVVNASAPLRLPWADRANAIVWTWFGGQEMGHALADVLLGHADPGGRLPTTFPARLEATAAHQDFPGEHGTVTYREELLIGHRWFDANGLTPAYPLGFGLSYADISLGNARADVGSETVSVTVTATNRSERAGSEVVQVYADAAVGAPDGTPVRQLAGFAKVRLEPGASAEVSVELPLRALASWDDAETGWRIAAGARRLRVGRSSADLPLHVDIEVSDHLLPTPQR
ncbi:MAG TPA: glycoside hydrolase family 3 C-terminal domain-containing protein [Mycobacteriales bacterium]|nr:glycoside hydrolase family 3 C-terminal domain-containing protein [Mycobacteriales bacterium]